MKTRITFPSPSFTDTEAAVLGALYEVGSDGSLNSYDLSRKLYPEVEKKGETQAFADVLDATEKLIARELVKGTRLVRSFQICFGDLKLTSKGEPEAIRERTRCKFVEWENPTLDEAPPSRATAQPSPVFEDEEIRYS